MSRLVPILITVLLALACPLSRGDILSAEEREEEWLEEEESVENNIWTPPTVSDVLTEIERLNGRIRQLEQHSLISDRIALAGISTLMFIAFNAVHNELLVRGIPGYQMLNLLSGTGTQPSAYHWILAIINYVLPSAVSGMLIMNLAQYDPRYPEIDFKQTLKTQLGVMLASTVPGAVAQILASRSTTLAPYFYLGQSSLPFRSLLSAAPIVISGIYCILARMTLLEQKIQVQLQLKNLHKQLKPLSSPPDKQDCEQWQPQ